MQLFPENETKKKPVHLSSGLSSVLGGQKTFDRPEINLNFVPAHAKGPDSQAGSDTARNQPVSGKPADRIRGMIGERGFVAHEDPTRPDDSPFKLAQERHERALEATEKQAKAGALAQLFSAISDMAIMFTQKGPVAVGHDRTGANLSQDALNRMAEEDQTFQHSLSQHFDQMFRHQQQKDQIHQANVQLLNQAISNEHAEIIASLKQALEDREQQVPQELQQAEVLLDLAKRLSGTASGQQAAVRIMEQLQHMGMFDDELNLSVDYLFQTAGIASPGEEPGEGGPTWRIQTGEEQRNITFEEREREVMTRQFDEVSGELVDISRQLQEAESAEVPDPDQVGRLRERREALQARHNELMENPAIRQHWIDSEWIRMQQQAFDDSYWRTFFQQNPGGLDRARALVTHHINTGQPQAAFRTAMGYISYLRKNTDHNGNPVITPENVQDFMGSANDVMQELGYDEDYRREALRAIAKDALGVELGGQTAQQQQESSGTKEALAPDETDPELTEAALSQLPPGFRQMGKAVSDAARIMQINEPHLNHENERIAQRSKKNYEQAKKKYEEALSRIQSLADTEGKQSLVSFVNDIESAIQSKSGTIYAER